MKNQELVCPLCFGSGVAVWVQDKVTKQFSPEPFRNSMLAWDYIHWCIANIPGVRGVPQTMRFYETAAQCTCKSMPAPRVTGYGARIRTAIPEPRMAQFEGMDWNSYPRDEVHSRAGEIAWAFAKQGHFEGKRGVMFAGVPGVGKTGLAWLIYKEGNPDRSAFVDYSRLIGFIQSTYGNNALTDTQDIMRALQEVPLLILDDVGDVASERAISDDRREKTYQILSARHEANKPTVVTTNLGWGQIAFQFGERIADRLRQLCFLVQIEGESMRR